MERALKTNSTWPWNHIDWLNVTEIFDLPKQLTGLNPHLFDIFFVKFKMPFTEQGSPLST